MRLIIGAIAASVLFFTIFPVFGEMSAKPYQPAESITVVSESIVSGDISPGGLDGIFWRITPETYEDGSFCLGFYRAETDDPVGRLVLAGANPGFYLADGARFSHVISASGLMLFPGFSVPCDLLPVNGACGNVALDIIEVRRQAGEKTFVEQFQVDCIVVSSADAMAQGWIMEPIGDAQTLILIRATNLRSGENVVRQLWVPGDTWWRYEETPFRRSWRLR